MAVGLTPICFSCIQGFSLRPGVGYVCRAFPGDDGCGIPLDILASKANHRKPFRGDKGIQYKPKSLDVAEDIAAPAQHAAMKPTKVIQSGKLAPHHLSQREPFPHRAHLAPVVDKDMPAIAQDPLTSKGEEILRAMQRQYGSEKGKQVFYASANKGTITGVHDALTRALGTDPPVSEAQRRLMWAKATGHGKSDVPVPVAKEFAEADPGGKLPARAAKDLSANNFKLLHWLLGKFFQEEAQETEHQEQDQLAERAPEAHKLGWTKEGGTVGVKARDEEGPELAAVGNQPMTRILPGDLEVGQRIYGPMWGCWDAPPEKRGAGVMFVTEDGRSLFLRRGSTGDHEGEWCFPGGRAEGDENQLTTARREAAEETGHTCPICGVECAASDGMRIVDHTRSHDGHHFTTFGHFVKDAFEPKINEEHTEAKWAPLDDPPNPLHPAVAATLKKALDLSIGGPGKAEKLGNQSGFDNASFEEIRDAVKSKASDPDALAAWIKDKTDPGWRKRDAGDRLVFEPSDVYGRRFASDWKLALDRRVYDEGGRLHVDRTPISKATVNGYRGDEINSANEHRAGWKMLDPDRMYNLLRAPDELAKAAKTFEGVPLLWKHKPSSATDHPSDITVGAIGNGVEFEDPYLWAPMVIWPDFASKAVEDETKRQISAGYAYNCDMTPGVYKGMKYDGVMRDIVGNHCAMVESGRAGPDVMVYDSSLPDQRWEALAGAISGLSSSSVPLGPFA